MAPGSRERTTRRPVMGMGNENRCTIPAPGTSVERANVPVPVARISTSILPKMWDRSNPMGNYAPGAIGAVDQISPAGTADPSI